jgi:hypothetical protein
VFLFVIFVLITIAGIIQCAPFTETPPTQMPSPLGSFNFTFLYILLAFPYYLPLFAYAFTGILPVHQLPLWLILAGNLVFLYILSCFFISGYNRNKRRFSIWHWFVIFILSVSLVSIGLFHGRIPANHLDLSLLFVAVSLIASLYLFLLFCLGFLVYDVIKRK